jgi:hypothetical protein
LLQGTQQVVTSSGAPGGPPEPPQPQQMQMQQPQEQQLMQPQQQPPGTSGIPGFAGTGGLPRNQDPEDETTTISEDLEKMNIDETDLEPETDNDTFADWVLL